MAQLFELLRKLPSAVPWDMNGLGLPEPLGVVLVLPVTVSVYFFVSCAKRVLSLLALLLFFRMFFWVCVVRFLRAFNTTDGIP